MRLRKVVSIVLMAVLVLVSGPVMGPLIGVDGWGTAEARGSAGRSGGFSVRSSSGGSWSTKPAAPPSKITSGGGSVNSGSKDSTPAITSPKPPAVNSAPTANSGGFSIGTTPKADPPKSGGFSVGGKDAGSSLPPSGVSPNKAPPEPSSWSTKPPKTEFTQKVNRETAAKAYEQRKESVAQVRNDPIFKQTTGGRTFDQSTIRNSRESWYRSNPTYTSPWRDRDRSYRPSYNGSYYGGGYYGRYDDVFLESMLGSAIGNVAGNAISHAFFYNHQNDPGIQAYLAEARQNDKLKDQVAQLEREMEKMKQQGTKVDPTYVPQGIPPEVMYNEEALTGKVNALEANDANSSSGGFPWFWTIFFIMLIGGVVFGFSMLNNRQARNVGW